MRQPTRPAALTLVVEKLLASAHRSIYSAHHLCEGTEYETLGDDLWELAIELERMHTSLLNQAGQRHRTFAQFRQRQMKLAEDEYRNTGHYPKRRLT